MFQGISQSFTAECCNRKGFQCKQRMPKLLLSEITSISCNASGALIPSETALLMIVLIRSCLANFCAHTYFNIMEIGILAQAFYVCMYKAVKKGVFFF